MRSRLFLRNKKYGCTEECWSDKTETEQMQLCFCDSADDLELLREVPEDEYWLSKIPEEFRCAISHIAYEQGHSCGEAEVLNILSDLCCTLAPCFEQWLRNHKPTVK